MESSDLEALSNFALERLVVDALVILAERASFRSLPDVQTREQAVEGADARALAVDWVQALTNMLGQGDGSVHALNALTAPDDGQPGPEASDSYTRGFVEATLAIDNKHYMRTIQANFECPEDVQIWITFENAAAAAGAPALWLRFKVIKDSDLTVYHVGTDRRVEDRGCVYIFGINEHWVTNAIKYRSPYQVSSPDAYEFILHGPACALRGDDVILNEDYPCIYYQQTGSEVPLCIGDEVFISPILIPDKYCDDLINQDDSEKLRETADKILEGASGDVGLNHILNEKVRRLMDFLQPVSTTVISAGSLP